ncbi:DNA-binding response regulator [Paenibacillus sp. NEAU-GSW1]|uniref:DNA-binding response regulator n=1 Tax=Paenibacillus sp. NEAU-GSW1 TaxID=2682486 RepID=UPI0012E29984|nr:DNA-binding response regulator [Paenibacillus sp. NEAU-GSW1]MUT65026.1 DNA-binding response regulator [Paenibacillus sp. NEAU-GSW1]
MTMEQGYADWMKQQTAAASGERKRRLLLEQRHAEEMFAKQIWWQAFGHFEFLYTEYEVSDFKDGQRFLDFAYIRPPYRICFEIDGYGPHHRDIDRDKFADGLMRQNHLVLDGWTVIRFSYDDIAKKPRQCQQLLHQLLGKLYAIRQQPNLSPHQKEILRYMHIVQKPVSPKEISHHLDISDRYARKLLKDLVEKHNLSHAFKGTKRIKAYTLQSGLSFPIL